VLDGRSVLTGSYNWTRGAARDNRENFMLTWAPEAVRSFSENFDRMWREMAPKKG
jgi:mitochondrial cardiolipin hydrolase